MRIWVRPEVLSDLLGVDQLVAMVRCPNLGLDEALECFRQRDPLLLAKGSQFMRLSPDFGDDLPGRPLVCRVGGTGDGLVLERELNVRVFRVRSASQHHPSPYGLLRAPLTELPAAVGKVRQHPNQTPATRRKVCIASKQCAPDPFLDHAPAVLKRSYDRKAVCLLTQCRATRETEEGKK